LYKLPNEKRLRTKLIDDVGAGCPETNNAMSTTQPIRNAAVKLLEQSDSEQEEVEPQPEQDIIN